jgi:hypothetical protein
VLVLVGINKCRENVEAVTLRSASTSPPETLDYYQSCLVRALVLIGLRFFMLNLSDVNPVVLSVGADLLGRENLDTLSREH